MKKSKNNYKINIYPLSILSSLMIIFVVSTLLQSVFDKIAINKILGALIVLFALEICIKNIKKSELIILLLLISCFFFSMIESKSIVQDITEWIYFWGTVFILLILCDDYKFSLFTKRLIKKEKLLSIVVNFGCLLILSLLVTKVGFITEWGEGTYFIGLCNEAHTMASVDCLLLSLILLRCKMVKKQQLYYVVLSFIPMLAILETGARTFLLPAVLFVILIIKTCINNGKIRFLVYIIGIFIFIFVAMKTSMVDKFSYAFNTEYSNNAIDSFTSGRSEFWIVDIDYYLNGNINQKLFGRNFTSVKLVNKYLFGNPIGSHNDIIYLLNGAGLIGTVIYIYVCIRTLWVLKKKIEKNTIWLMCCIYMVVPMWINGFFTYQHYVYSFIMLYVSLSFNKEFKNKDNTRQ